MTDVFHLADHLCDVHAVIADRCIAVGARRREIGEKAAKTISDRADLSGHARQVTQLCDRGLDVFDAGYRR